MPRQSLITLLATVSIMISASAYGSVSAADGSHAVRIDAGGVRLNSVLLEPYGKRDLPPIVFIHGASASLHDPMFSFRRKLEGRAKLLFVDRPGHGGSDIGGKTNILPDGQADAIARLMARRGIPKAIIVSHSFGGAIAAALASRHSDMVSGLVFLSPAVYPWEGGVAWYYDAAAMPISGALFSTLVAPPIGLLAIDRATRAVFAPNLRPPGYIGETKALQTLRPAAFRHNAREVAALSEWARAGSLSYRNIAAPTVIITGDADEIVSPEVHARHLARDIQGARLIVIHNLGHKSDYVASDVAIGAIEMVAGRKVNLAALSKAVERRIAGDGKD